MEELNVNNEVERDNAGMQKEGTSLYLEKGSRQQPAATQAEEGALSQWGATLISRFPPPFFFFFLFFWVGARPFSTAS